MKTTASLCFLPSRVIAPSGRHLQLCHSQHQSGPLRVEQPHALWEERQCGRHVRVVEVLPQAVLGNELDEGVVAQHECDGIA
jgi:hypothetical protein